MRRLLTAGSAVIWLVWVVAGAGAAPASKTVVCHAKGNGSFIPIEVADAAVESHLDHGDVFPGTNGLDVNCNPVTVLARAFSVDGDGAERLIAQLEDVDADGLPSVGDVIRTDQYPLDLDALTFDELQVKEHVLTAIYGFEYTTEWLKLQPVDTSSGPNQIFWWLLTDAGNETYLEQPDLGSVTAFADRFGLGGDIIQINTSSPSQPASFVFTSVFRVGDQDFINIEIVPPPAP